MKHRTRTADELQRVGFAALTKALGPIDAIRFLHQFGYGKGDYTAERHKLFENLTVDDIMSQIKAARRAKSKRAKAR